MALQTFSPKDPDAKIIVTFNFKNLMDGDTLVSCVFDCGLQGLGTFDSTMLVGIADISASPIVKQEIQGGLVGNTYLVRALLTTSSGRILVGAGLLPIVLGGGC